MRIPRTTKGTESRDEQRLRELDRKASGAGDSVARLSARLDELPRGLVWPHGSRGVNIYPISAQTETLVMELEVPLQAGRLYKIETITGVWTDGAGRAIGESLVRFTSDGTPPILSSPVLLQSATGVEEFGYVTPIAGWRIFRSDDLGGAVALRLRWGFYGHTGGKTYGLYASGGWVAHLLVHDLGRDRTDDEVTP